MPFPVDLQYCSLPYDGQEKAVGAFLNASFFSVKRGMLRSFFWAIPGAIWLIIALSIAAPNLNTTQVLALERYGPQAANTISDWRRLIEESRNLEDDEKLKRVNLFFNRRMLFRSDKEVWQQEDYWATPLEFVGRSAGDCEDFTIAKYVTLQMLGIGNDRLRLIYVRAKSSSVSEAHMVLGFFPQPTDEPLVLDNLISSIRKASQRPDLSPVFSFNDSGLWVGGASASAADPVARLSRWRDLLERLHDEGIR